MPDPGQIKPSKLQGLMQNIASSLSESFAFAAKKVGTGGQEEGNRDEHALDMEPLGFNKERVQQSQRIHLRLLLKQERFEEAAIIAQNTDDEVMASIAVWGLAEFSQETLASDRERITPRLHCLFRLAHSYSLAASKALSVYFHQVDPDEARKVFLSRMQQQHWQYMAKNGLCQAQDLLILSSQMDEYFETGLAPSHFVSIWQALQGESAKQLKLLGSILGDPEPMGLRYSHAGVAVSREIKLEAINLCDKFPREARERLLVYAAQEDCDDVAHAATYKLVNYWGSAQGAIPQNLEPFNLLKVNLNFHLAHMASSFAWEETDSLSKELDADETAAALERLKGELKQAKEKMIPEEIRTAKARLEMVERDAQKLAQVRVNSLQKLVNRLCGAMDMPSAIVETTDSENLSASYTVGAGRIAIGRNLLLTNDPLSEYLMATLLHELLHMEQDVQTIKLISDSLGLTFGQHSSDLKELIGLYTKCIGYAPDSIFLLAVLRMRDDVHLNDLERQRAERLYQGSFDCAGQHTRSVRQEKQLEKIEKALNTLERGERDHELLLCLKDEKGMSQLFQRGRIPVILVQELNECRQEIEEILTSMQRQIPREHANHKDRIGLAMLLINQGVRRPFVPVLRRIKLLLQQVMQEEARKLRIDLTNTRREGYHEEEAYYITDRTMVIVKALRKGWYRM